MQTGRRHSFFTVSQCKHSYHKRELITALPFYENWVLYICGPQQGLVKVNPRPPFSRGPLTVPGLKK